MDRANKGSSVKVHYTGKLDDGSIFDSTKNDEPLEFTLGEGNIIPGFENAVMGMAAGEKKTEKIPAAQAYGEPRTELLLEVERERIPDEIELEVGATLAMEQEGQKIDLKVAKVTENTVTLDANHPLAGKDLTFEIHLVEIQ